MQQFCISWIFKEGLEGKLCRQFSSSWVLRACCGLYSVLADSELVSWDEQVLLPLASLELWVCQPGTWAGSPCTKDKSPMKFASLLICQESRNALASLLCQVCFQNNYFNRMVSRGLSRDQLLWVFWFLPLKTCLEEMPSQIEIFRKHKRLYRSFVVTLFNPRALWIFFLGCLYRTMWSEKRTSLHVKTV